MRPDLLARFISPTLGLAFVDGALGVELLVSGLSSEGNTFLTATGGYVGAGVLFLTIGIGTVVGTFLAGRARRTALLVNVLLWTFVTATLIQADGRAETLFLPTMTAGFALVAVFRYLQVKGLNE